MFVYLCKYYMDLNSSYAMYIFVNTDLKMDKGKIGGQVGHLVQTIIEKILLDLIPMENPDDKTQEIISSYIKWKAHSGVAKVVLKATQEELEKLIKDYDAFYIRDAGKTQIAPNSLTVAGFYPGLKSLMEPITCKFKLL